jgi:hypothetical protein
LAAEWIDTFLPKGVRRAWEEQHPAMRAASRHKFALAGGNALIAHGIVDWFTQDILAGHTSR